MRQLNSFFSQPVIFYGPNENEEENTEDENQEIELSGLWFASNPANSPNLMQQYIGLQFQWYDVNE